MVVLQKKCVKFGSILNLQIIKIKHYEFYTLFRDTTMFFSQTFTLTMTTQFFSYYVSWLFFVVPVGGKITQIEKQIL